MTALPAAQPSRTDPSPNFDLINPIAPEMTAVSYPNNIPPSAAMEDINTIFTILLFIVKLVVDLFSEGYYVTMPANIQTGLMDDCT